MGTEEDANTATNDCLAPFVESPREAYTWSEIEMVRIVRLVGITKCAEVHFAKISSRFEIHNLSGSVRRWTDFDNQVIVITQAQIQNKRSVDTPIVLYECPELIQMTVMRRFAVHEYDRIRNIC